MDNGSRVFVTKGPDRGRTGTVLAVVGPIADIRLDPNRIYRPTEDVQCWVKYLELLTPEQDAEVKKNIEALAAEERDSYQYYMWATD